MRGVVGAGFFDAAGIRVAISTDHDELALAIRETLRDLIVDDSRPPVVTFEVVRRVAEPREHRWVISRDGERRETVDYDYVLPYLVSEISRIVFERCGDRVHLHAAAVAMGNDAVVLAGRSRAGKSTLAAWLAHQGWGFLADEVALVDPISLEVLPFWRPIGVRSPGPLDALLAEPETPRHPAERLVPASQFGSLAPKARLRALVLPDRSRSRRTTLVPLSPAAALVELARHFPGLIDEGREGFRRLALVVQAAPAFALHGRALDDADAALRTLIRPPA